MRVTYGRLQQLLGEKNDATAMADSWAATQKGTDCQQLVCCAESAGPFARHTTGPKEIKGGGHVGPETGRAMPVKTMEAGFAEALLGEKEEPSEPREEEGRMGTSPWVSA